MCAGKKQNKISHFAFAIRRFREWKGHGEVIAAAKKPKITFNLAEKIRFFLLPIFRLFDFFSSHRNSFSPTRAVTVIFLRAKQHWTNRKNTGFFLENVFFENFNQTLGFHSTGSWWATVTSIDRGPSGKSLMDCHRRHHNHRHRHHVNPMPTPFLDGNHWLSALLNKVFRGKHSIFKSNNGFFKATAVRQAHRPLLCCCSLDCRLAFDSCSGAVN